MTFHTSPPDAPTGPRTPERSRSRLVDLLDVQLERRFAPLLVRWPYIGSLALIAAVTLFGLLMSWWLASSRGVPISIAGGLVWAPGVRLVCETRAGEISASKRAKSVGHARRASRRR